MLLAIIAVAALAWWLHGQGRLLPNLVRLGGAAAAALVALRLLETGRVIAAAAVALAGYAWWRWQASRASAPGARVTAAARLLGVPADAGSDVVWDAWRRAMASAHPDAGGSDEAAQALTAARDLLVAHAARRGTRAR